MFQFYTNRVETIYFQLCKQAKNLGVHGIHDNLNKFRSLYDHVFLEGEGTVF